MTTPQYFADLVAWGAIGARTTESQVHRELASGLSCPVGFKNGTDGNVRIALDAVKSASQPHHFLAVTKDGRSAIATTTGNDDCHIILRGGKATNYDAASVEAASAEAVKAGIRAAIMIDASHANSSKKPENQPLVLADVAPSSPAATAASSASWPKATSSPAGRIVVEGKPLVYGQSITDGCIDWDDDGEGTGRPCRSGQRSTSPSDLATGCLKQKGAFPAFGWGGPETNRDPGCGDKS
jgi:3-deoxy-7-phosphoheptulonate synthase